MSFGAAPLATGAGLALLALFGAGVFTAAGGGETGCGEAGCGAEPGGGIGCTASGVPLLGGAPGCALLLACSGELLFDVAEFSLPPAHAENNVTRLKKTMYVFGFECFMAVII